MITTGAVTPLPLAGALITGTESTTVRAPYDGDELGRVPALTAGDVDRGVRAPRGAWRRGRCRNGVAPTFRSGWPRNSPGGLPSGFRVLRWEMASPGRLNRS